MQPPGENPTGGKSVLPNAFRCVVLVGSARCGGVAVRDINGVGYCRVHDVDAKAGRVLKLERTPEEWAERLRAAKRMGIRVVAISKKRRKRHIRKVEA